jgi:predicted DNA-binding transcriptional regulator YafY
MPASTLAAELEVSVRTVYRDLEALSAAGVPVIAESGPGGGCELLAGYRFPLRGLRPDEAEALLILGIPPALRDLGLDGTLATAHRQIRVTAGMPDGRGTRHSTGDGTAGSTADGTGDSTGDTALVHLDMPRWFASSEEVPELRTLAQAVRRGKQLAFSYGDRPPRIAGPLGLVNKAGIWYLVAVTSERPITVFRAGRVGSARLLAEPVERPAGFGLAGFWAQWSAEFTASRPRIPVTVSAAPAALAVFPEIFGDGIRAALAVASAPDETGWRVVTLSFEHELAAVHRLAGFGNLVRVQSPPEVRARLLATAREILQCYGS